MVLQKVKTANKSSKTIIRKEIEKTRVFKSDIRLKCTRKHGEEKINMLRGLL